MANHSEGRYVGMLPDISYTNGVRHCNRTIFRNVVKMFRDGIEIHELEDFQPPICRCKSKSHRYGYIHKHTHYIDSYSVTTAAMFTLLHA